MHIPAVVPTPKHNNSTHVSLSENSEKKCCRRRMPQNQEGLLGFTHSDTSSLRPSFEAKSSDSRLLGLPRHVRKKVHGLGLGAKLSPPVRKWPQSGLVRLKCVFTRHQKQLSLTIAEVPASSSFMAVKNLLPGGRRWLFGDVSHFVAGPDPSSDSKHHIEQTVCV